jgi:hypothetical protein
MCFLNLFRSLFLLLFATLHFDKAYGQLPCSGDCGGFVFFGSTPPTISTSGVWQSQTGFELRFEKPLQPSSLGDILNCQDVIAVLQNSVSPLQKIYGFSSLEFGDKDFCDITTGKIKDRKISDEQVSGLVTFKSGWSPSYLKRNSQAPSAFKSIFSQDVTAGLDTAYKIELKGDVKLAWSKSANNRITIGISMLLLPMTKGGAEPERLYKSIANRLPIEVSGRINCQMYKALWDAYRPKLVALATANSWGEFASQPVDCGV